MRKELQKRVANAPDEKHKLAAQVLDLEFERLQKQRCPYCDGFGHSGNDCPTDAKISHIRGGVKEQNTVITEVRKSCRLLAGMGKVTGFSLLSADPQKSGLGKRTGK